MVWSRIGCAGVLTVVLAACNSTRPPVIDTFGPVAITDENRALANRLKAELERTQASLEPELRPTAQFMDYDAGYAYDAQAGLIRLNLGTYDPASNVIRFEDQSILSAPTAQPRRGELSSMATESNACAPYRQVRSIKNFIGVQTNLSVSSPAGLSAGEASYNYFSTYFDASADLESGIVSSGNELGEYVTGKWYGYMRGQGVTTTTKYRVLRDLFPNDTRPNGGRGGFDSGAIFMRFFINAPGYITFLLSVPGASKSYTVGVPAARRLPGAQNVRWGRTTSLLTNTGAANSGLSEWSNVSVLQHISPTVYQPSQWASNFTAPGYPLNIAVNPGTPPGTPCPSKGAISIDDTFSFPDFLDTFIITQQ